MKDKFYTEYRDLGYSILYFRKQCGLTQWQLADIMDVSYETVSRMENASSGYSLDMLIALTKALEISLSELFAHARL